MQTDLKLRFPGYETCELDVDRPAKGNRGALVNIFHNRVMPCKEYTCSVYCLGMFIDARYPQLYKLNKTKDGLMVTKPSDVGVLIQEKDLELYLKRKASLRTLRKTYNKDQEQAENCMLNDLYSKVKEDPDVILDHVLYKFPTPLLKDKDGSHHSEIILYTDKSSVKTKGGQNVDTTRTNYWRWVYVGIAGTKKPIKRPGDDVEGITSEIEGMVLSPSF